MYGHGHRWRVHGDPCSCGADWLESSRRAEVDEKLKLFFFVSIMIRPEHPSV